MPTDNDNELLEQYFKNAPVAIMIFKDEDLLMSNKLAQCLQKHLQFDPHYLVQLAKSQDSKESPIHGCCSNCAICMKMSEKAMPVLAFSTNDEDPANYYMTYTKLAEDNHLFALTLKNYGAVKRIDKLADKQKLNRYVSKANEQERKTISADLHDSIAQGVYCAIRGIRRLETVPTKDLHQLTQTIENQLNETLTEVKNMALDVRPSVLDNFGLFSALRSLATRLEESSGLSITVVGNAKPEQLSTEVQNSMYRICQESINNALKHANASEIVVLLSQHNHFINLEIIDNGDGFETSETESFNGHSLGLRDMSSRIRALNGVFKVHSELTIGTTITVTFPVQIEKGSLSHE